MSLAQNRFIGVGVYPGFMMAHRPDLQNLAAHNLGVEVYAEKVLKAENWASNYREPMVGYSLVYYDFGKEISGKSIGGLVNFKFKVAELRKTDVYFNMGAGMSYLTKRFEVFDNRRNVAIGSHLNGSMQLALLAKNEVKDWQIDYGVGITHYSNAAFKLPNLGYNNPSVMLKIGRKLSSSETQSITKPSPGLGYNFTLIYGRKQQDFSNPVEFNNWGLQSRVLWSKNGFSKWRAGLDLAIDKTYAFSQNITIDLSSIPIEEKLEIALAGGYQWNFGKVDLITEAGVYVYKPVDFKKQVLERVGVKYNFTNQLSAQSLLRFHRAVADYLELGVSYTL